MSKKKKTRFRQGFSGQRKKINIIPRLIILSFVIIACVQAVSSILAFTSPEFAFAGGSSGSFDEQKLLEDYEFQTQIGDEKSISFKDYSTAPIAEYIKILYKYAIGIVGIVSAVVLMIGGVLWLTAGGNATQVGEAIAWIGSSITGLVLVLTSYLILSQINTDLVNLKITNIKSVPKIENFSFKGCDWEEGKGTFKNECSENKIKQDNGLCDPKQSTVSATELKIEICCCDMPTISDYTFDEGIKQQQNDASIPLKNLLSCMRGKMPSDVGRISSISDSAGLINCLGNNWTEEKCAHTKNSCHYGGKIVGTKGMDLNSIKSLAVDFGDEENARAIISAAKECGKDLEQTVGIIFGTVGHEDHIHISVNCNGI